MKLAIILGVATFFSVAASFVTDPEFNGLEDVLKNDGVKLSEGYRIKKEMVEEYKRNISTATENLRLITENIFAPANTTSLRGKCLRYFHDYERKAREILSDLNEYIDATFFALVEPNPEVLDAVEKIMNELSLSKITHEKINNFVNESKDVLHQTVACVLSSSHQTDPQ